MMLAQGQDLYRGIAALIINGGLAIPGVILFDQLIRYMYEHRRDVWEAEERPCGLFYSPPGARHWHTWARQYAVDWTLRTPEWMRDEPACLRKLYLIRCLQLAAVVGTLIVLFTPII
jgi:hypothetical protein